MSCELSLPPGGDQSPRRLVLAGELCVFHAGELKQSLLAHLAASRDCELDLSQVSEVDTAGIQLLLLAKREASKLGCTLRFVNHSNPLLDVIELLNLGSDFGDPLLIPATGGPHEHG